MSELFSLPLYIVDSDQPVQPSTPTLPEVTQKGNSRTMDKIDGKV